MLALARHLHLAYLSKPKSERILYRTVRRLRAKTIVELGTGDAHRAHRLLATAARYSDETPSYTGFDLFESRPSHAPGITLKKAHRELRTTGAKIRLLPGPPEMMLPQLANSLMGTDLVIINSELQGADLDATWRFLPRMLDDHSLVLIGQRDAETADGETRYRVLSKQALPVPAEPMLRRAA